MKDYEGSWESLSIKNKSLAPFGFETTGALGQLGRGFLQTVANHMSREDPTVPYSVLLRQMVETVSITIHIHSGSILLNYIERIKDPKKYHALRLPERYPNSDAT